MQIEAAKSHLLTGDQLSRISPEWREDALRRQSERLEAHRHVAELERPVLIDFESHGYATNCVGALKEYYADYT
ncbi:MAG: hypothetical protein WCG75_07365, partial [Armatimonadota bacterium]